MSKATQNDSSLDTSNDEQSRKEYEELSELLDSALEDFTPRNKSGRMSEQDGLINSKVGLDRQSASDNKTENANTAESDDKRTLDNIPESHIIPKSVNKPKIDDKRETNDKPEIVDKADSDFKAAGDRKATYDSGAASTSRTGMDVFNFSWDDEFLRAAAAQLEENMHLIFNADELVFTPEEINENIRRLSEIGEAASGEESLDFDFSEIVGQTLRELSESNENFQANFSDEEIFALLGAFNTVMNSNLESGDIKSLVEHFMRVLLSRDLVLPCLRSLTKKYPQWLEDNRSTLTLEDNERFTEQVRILKEIRAELEEETADDSERIKEERFNRIMLKMNEIFRTGQPPSALIGSNPLADFERTTNTDSFIKVLNQCNLM